MFDFFRNNIKFLMGLLILLIIPSFVLFGVEGYSNFRENRDVVAHVGKTEITRQEWDATHRAEVDRMVANMPGVDRSLLDNAAGRRATLDRMVNDRVLSLAAQDGRFLATDQRLARELTQDPGIARLRQADGKLDLERYQQLLRAQGQTPESFEAGVRADLARRQVSQGVTAAGFLPTKVANVALDAYFERREVQWTRFTPAQFRASVKVSNEDVKSYYDTHTAQFQTTEQADVEYLLLDLDAVAKTLRLSEADLRAYHEQNSANLAQKEQRRARHILLTVEASAPAEQKAKVKAEAEKIRAQLSQTPQGFAELARTRSQDPGSATQGGDLDFFPRGAMVKPFEDVAFALKPGELSGVVETEFGYHIIEVTDIRRPAPEPFEKVRPRLEAELLRQQAQRQFAEVAEEFSNLVYEQSDTLAPAAAKLGLTVHRVQGLTRDGTLPSGNPVVKQAKVLQAVFASDAARLKRNSAALEIGPNQLVSVRVVEHRPAMAQPLDAVAQQVRGRLTDERALAMAQNEGKAKLAAWQAQPAAAALGNPLVVSRVETNGFSPEVLAAAMSTPAGAQTPGWAGAELAQGGGYAVVRVNRVLPRAPADALRAGQERDQLAQLWSQAESQAYLAALRARYKAQVVEKALEKSE